MDRQARLASLLADDGRWVPPLAYPAATMVLLRDGHVLLLRRAATMAFAPRMHVFPGGKVERADQDQADPLMACAQRETLEEVSIRVNECRLIDRWVTPESEERRYDVSFYLAHTDEFGMLSTTEADEMFWHTPDQALRLHEQSSLAMLRPTIAVLKKLADMEAGRVEDPAPVVAKLPRLRPDGLWDVVEAGTGVVLESGVAGPRRAETDGTVIT